MRFYNKYLTEEELKAKEIWEIDFAWFPIWIGPLNKGCWVWLENYWKKPIYSRGRVYCDYGKILDYEYKLWEKELNGENNPTTR